MKISLIINIIILILLSLSSLKANELSSISLQEKISIKLSIKIDKKFDDYKQIIKSQKKIMLDNLSFLDLYEKDIYSLNKNANIIVINEIK